MEIKVDFLKEYLKVDHDEEDALLEKIISFAIGQCETYLNRPLLEKNMTDENRWTVPAQIELAVLLLCSHWYENRSLLLLNQTRDIDVLPFGVHAILHPYTFRELA